MTEPNSLAHYKAQMDDAFKDLSFYVRLKREDEILTEARRHLTRTEFQELKRYASERLK